MIESFSETNGLSLLSSNDEYIYSIGISTGGLAEIHMAKILPYCQIVATTIDREGADFARTLIVQEGLEDKIEVKIEDISQPLPYNEESFDFIYARLVLHYLPKVDLIPALQELHRILKPSGRIFVVVRSKECAAAQSGEYNPETGMTKCSDEDGRIYSRYFHDPASISEHLRDAGFEIIHLKEYKELLCKDFQRTQLSEEKDCLIEVFAIRGGRTSFQ